ncbi:MAG: AMP-binding protein [Pseudomonadota bacterium]
MSDAARPDYGDFYDSFDADAYRATFAGSFADGINACVECCDRHAGSGRIAVRWEDQEGASGSLTFDELTAQSARFANLLAAKGVGPGDRVSGLLPRTPELFSVIMGILRLGAVYQPLFTAFGPKAIEHRLDVSQAKIVVTDPANRPKLDEIEDVPQIITIGAQADSDIDFHAAMAEQSDTFEPVIRTSTDAFLMMATSGTTGAPKGVNVPLDALASFKAYMQFGVDLRPDDNYWNIADPGWAYGLFYVIFGPLMMGCTTTLIDGPFTVDRTIDVIRRYKITNLAGAPTAYRMMIAEGEKVQQAIRAQLRVASSAGEPLNPEVMRWFEDKLECPLHDHYGQTEMAMVLMNHHALAHPVRPGSAGRPMPGYALAVVDEDGNPVPDNEPGILAVDRMNSPLWYFQGYAGREGEGWVGDYYLTGDSVERSPDGYFTFVGRSDDLISSAGYRIGPFDVESCLIEHEAVLESGVVGKPDAERGHIVKAFVVLNEGYDASDELSEEIRLHVRARLGGHAYPREIEFRDALPKTPSGKIQRFILRDQA